VQIFQADKEVVGGMPIQISRANKEVFDNNIAQQDVEDMPNVMPLNAFQNQKAGNTVNIQKNSEDRGDFHKANTNFENEENNIIVQPLRKKDTFGQDINIEEIDLSDDEFRKESVNRSNGGRSELFGLKAYGNKGQNWALPTGKNTETNQIKNNNDRPGTADQKPKSKKKKQEEEKNTRQF